MKNIIETFMRIMKTFMESNQHSGLRGTLSSSAWKPAHAPRVPEIQEFRDFHKDMSKRVARKLPDDVNGH